MRRIQTLVTDCGEWVGTAHAAGMGEGAGAHTEDIGCLLLNFGHMPRSGVGDLSTHLADLVARQGLPTWRFDFPGLGDSLGHTPALERQLFRQIQTGMFVEPCLQLLQVLSGHTGIGNWVLGGLCGGAVTAVLAADHAPERIAGLLLIDLDVSLLSMGEEELGESLESQQGTPGQDESASSLSSGLVSAPRGPALQRFFSRRTWIRFATGEGRLKGRLPFLRHAVARWIEDDHSLQMPPDVNTSVVTSFRRLLERETPVLSVRAKGKMRDLYAGSVDRVLFPSVLPAYYQVLRLEGTNHVFTARDGEERVLAAVSSWLPRVAAVCARREAAAATSMGEELA